jgi:glucose dehydrogenase
VWALDAATGKMKWKFNTVVDGAKLWGNPNVNTPSPPSTATRCSSAPCDRFTRNPHFQLIAYSLP